MFEKALYLSTAPTLAAPRASFTKAKFSFRLDKHAPQSGLDAQQRDGGKT